MSLINKDYFFNEFKIASLDTVPVSERITYYINTYEPEYLEKLLGKTLYAAYYEDVGATRFIALIAKLKEAPSPIAAYVFFEYQNGQSLQATAGADAKIKLENASASINTYRRADAWNIMAKRSWDILQWIKTQTVDLEEFNIKEVDCELFVKTNAFGI